MSLLPDPTSRSVEQSQDEQGQHEQGQRRVQAQRTFYDAVGGAETFARLVHRFYEGVAADPVLRPLYPEEDLSGAEERLRMFLAQYWGGPRTYSAQRGHPRLQLRHAPFAVTPTARDAWLRHMRAAVDSLGLPAEADQMLWTYLTTAAHGMVNTLEEEPASVGPDTTPGSTPGSTPGEARP